MMITSSEPTIARWRFAGGAIGKRTSARPRRTCVSLFMITGQAPRSTQTSATARCLVGAVVVADDRDDVALLDGEADVDDQRRVAQRVRRYRPPLPSTSPLLALRVNRGSTSLREPLHLAELVDGAEAADEVVDARLGERPDPVRDLLRACRPAPSWRGPSPATAPGSTSRCSRRRRRGPRPRSRRCSSSPGRR